MLNKKITKSLNNVVNINSYLILEKLSSNQYVRVNFTIQFSKLRYKSSCDLLKLYKYRKKVAQKFLLKKIYLIGELIKKGNEFYLEDISANLKIRSVEKNYDLRYTKKGIHTFRVSDLY